MPALPTDWPQLSSTLFYDDAGAAIDWLCRAFGFEIRIRIDGEHGEVVHSELQFQDALVMVASSDRALAVSPKGIGGRGTQSLFVYVEDVDAHCARARAAGARIVSEPKDSDYGEEYWADRGYECLDLEGHRWWFAHRVRSPKRKA